MPSVVEGVLVVYMDRPCCSCWVSWSTGLCCVPRGVTISQTEVHALSLPCLYKSAMLDLSCSSRWFGLHCVLRVIGSQKEVPLVSLAYIDRPCWRLVMHVPHAGVPGLLDFAVCRVT